MKTTMKKSKGTRTTVTLPDPLDREAEETSEQTGVSISDLCRQGMIRILLERRETGSVKLMQLPALTA